MSGNHQDRLRYRRATLPTLPVIQDVKEPTSDVQDFCEALFGVSEDQNPFAQLQVRSSDGNFYEEIEKRGKPILYERNIRRPAARRGSLNDVGKSETKKNTPLQTRRIKSKSQRLSGKTKERATNAYNYSPEVIDLTTEEDVEKVALKFFSQEMRIDNETLENTLERIYGSDNLDWDCKCLEFSQVGNCNQAFSSSKTNHILPDINTNNISNKANADHAQKNNSSVKLPSIFQAFYSDPVRLKLKDKDEQRRMESRFDYRRKRHSIS